MYRHVPKTLTRRRRSFWTAASPSSPFTKHSENFPKKPDYDILFSSLPPTQVSTLPNRLRVATQSLPTNTMTVGIWVDPGPYSTSSKFKEVEHLLDRLIYKGTDLEKEIATMGGDLVALTSREQISFQATGLINYDDALQSIQWLGGVLQYPRFRDEDVYRELAVVSRERQKAEDHLTKDFLLENLHASAFQNSAMGIPVVGSASKTITKGDLLHYMSEHFTPDRMVLVAAGGGIQHEEIVQQAKCLCNKPTRGGALDGLSKQGRDLFKKVSRAGKVLFQESEDIFTGSEVLIDDCGELLGKFAIAFKGASWADRDVVPLMVIKELLGSTLLARIGSNDIAKSMMTFNTNYKDVGLFGVYAIAKPDCLGDLASLVMLELTELCSKVSPDDLVRARNKVKASMLLNIDKTRCVAEDIGRQQTYMHSSAPSMDGYNQPLPATAVPGYPQQGVQPVSGYRQPGVQQASGYAQAGTTEAYVPYPSSQPVYTEQAAQF